MKRVIIVLVFLTSIILVYLLYRYQLNDKWNRAEYFLLAITLVLGVISSLVIEFRRRKGRQIPKA